MADRLHLFYPLPGGPGVQEPPLLRPVLPCNCNRSAYQILDIAIHRTKVQGYRILFFYLFDNLKHIYLTILSNNSIYNNFLNSG